MPLTTSPVPLPFQDVVAKRLGVPPAFIQLELTSGGSGRLLDDGENIRPGWQIRGCRLVPIHIFVAA